MNVIGELFDKMMIQFGDFTLKDGRHSPIYFNLRPLPSYPELLEQVAMEMLRKVHSEQFLGTRIVGLPLSGIPLAVAMGLIGNIPVLYPRLKIIGAGQNHMEGVYRLDEDVIVVDDVLTDGAIKRHQIVQIRSCGLSVCDLIVVIDRQEGGERSLALDKIRVHSLFNTKEIVETLRRDCDLSDYEYQRTMKYLEEL